MGVAVFRRRKPFEDKDIRREQDPEAEISGSTARGERRSRGRTALRVEIGLEGWNPMSGTGMKQGRQGTGGSRPREREKRCGGSVTRGVESLGVCGCPFPGTR
jgi:hypothetical protein